MRNVVCSIAALGAVLMSALPMAQDRLDAAGLKAMTEGLGYELRPLSQEVGKEKWEFKVTQGDLDIPIGIELSGSKNYVWLSVLVAPGVQAASLKPEGTWAILRQNANIQPSQFYASSKDNLLIALAVENRALTPAMLRRAIDKLAADVVSTQPVWSSVK